MESIRASVPTGGPSEASNLNETTFTVCRFLVKDLHAKNGYADSDFYVDLVVEKHTLYDLVSIVFGILHANKLTDDGIDSHLWSLNLGETKFSEPWCRRVLNSIATSLSDGQQGGFEGESASFGVVVEKSVLEEIEASTIQSYPKTIPISVEVSSNIDDDWVAGPTKFACEELRSNWDMYYSGDNAWKRCKRNPKKWILGKPSRTRWEGDELRIMGLLLSAGAKFKESWRSVLRYAFPDRVESGTSYQWYQLRRDASCYGQNMSVEKCVRLAKRLARSSMQKFLDGGVPRREAHPQVRLEANLRKRGLIDDTTSPATKKERLRTFQGEL